MKIAQVLYFYLAPLVMFALGYLLGHRRGFSEAEQLTAQSLARLKRILDKLESP